MSNTLDETLEEKIEWALASSLKAPAGSSSRMAPLSDLKKVEYDLQIKRVEELVLSEARRIGLEAIGEKDPVNIVHEVDGMKFPKGILKTEADKKAAYNNELRNEQMARLSELTGGKE